MNDSAFTAAGEVVPVYGGTTGIGDWMAAGKALPVGTETGWAARPAMAAQWRSDLNAGLDITQVPLKLSVVAFYWTCERGHTWRETPYKRNDAPTGRAPKWKRRAGTRAACRECVLEEFGIRFSCGHRLDNLGQLGPYTIPQPCPTCAGIVAHTYACGRMESLHVSHVPAASTPCPTCVEVAAALDADPSLKDRLTRTAMDGLPTGHGWVWWRCEVPGHDPYQQPVTGLLLGYGCPRCWKMTQTAGVDTAAGEVFKSTLEHPTSATEEKLRKALAEYLPVADPAEANAVSIHGDFFGRGEVYPDVLIPTLKVAVELDSPGRHGDWHQGVRAYSDRAKDEKLHEVGWRVIRVRLGGLPPVDHAECVSGSGVSARLVAEVVAVVLGNSG